MAEGKRSRAIEAAAHAIGKADRLVICAGAGMGVDSGLPDFRGDRGFWRAYPAFERLGLSFVDLANPAWFDEDQRLAWGFYGHRMHLYRDTQPHAGFARLLEWGQAASTGYFVFTSNVDGHFQKAGFDDQRVVECHGSLAHLQCVRPCADDIWPAADVSVDVDLNTFHARGPLPRCPLCAGLARPNVLMFGDWKWTGDRTAAQERRFQRFLSDSSASSLVVVECGAGSAVPTVRYTSEQLLRRLGATLVRINPRESQGPGGTISIGCGALEALQEIERLL